MTTERCPRFAELEALIARGWGSVPGDQIAALIAEHGDLPAVPPVVEEPEDEAYQPPPIRPKWGGDIFARRYTYMGREWTITELAAEMGVERAALQYRLKICATVEEAITEAREKSHQDKLYRHSDGRAYTLAGWHRATGISTGALRWRLIDVRMSVDDAVRMPVQQTRRTGEWVGVSARRRKQRSVGE